jgi:hypothetical protein
MVLSSARLALKSGALVEHRHFTATALRELCASEHKIDRIE